MQRIFTGPDIPATYGKAPALPSGLVHDTGVLTMRGLLAVQDLKSGDLLVTPRGEATALRRIETVSIVTRLVYVIAGTLGHRSRETDTLLCAGQTVLVRDWRAAALCRQTPALICAGRLTDGEYVRDLGCGPVTLYRLFCDRPEVFCGGHMDLGTADCPARMPCSQSI